MQEIKVLDINTINKIAAGEVIDRPSSIVKELLENSIDAKATMISIEIKDGGNSLIRITDNGKGIKSEDVRCAFLRHSTSKISTSDDLFNISTLGFRGEALSSISAVSMVELITKTKDELTGTRYCIEGGVESCFESVGVPNGTTFLVKNLFFNTPARKKFLKSSNSEALAITEIVEKLALSHPEVAIKYVNSSKLKFQTNGSNDVKEVIYNLFGKNITKEVLEVKEQIELIGVSGYIGKPLLYRGNRGFENYFINGRYIKNKTITKAIEDAYKQFLMQHQYPFVVLYINIENSLVDVNVHPSKMEVRFHDNNMVYNIVYKTIVDALFKKELIPEVSFENKKNDNEGKDESSKKSIGFAEPFEYNRILEEKSRYNDSVIFREVISNENNYNVYNSYNENHNDIKHVDEKNVEEKYINEKYTEENHTEKKYMNNKTDIDQTQQKIKSPKISQYSLEDYDNRLISQENIKKHKIIGQLFNTYWIVEMDNNMFVIDQHAAHEKVLYERFIKKFKEKEISSQRINPPIVVSVSLSNKSMIMEHLEEFKKIGFEIEEFGGNDFAVYSVPSDLYSLSVKEVLIDIMDNFESVVKLQSEFIYEKIASMSCKAAVKGNQSLSYEEIVALIDDLLTLENPYNCPHGRPVIISMSKYEIEKRFKRII